MRTDELYQKRKEIVCGEKDVPQDPDAAEVIEEDGEGDDEEGQETTGIPDFWLIALRNHEVLDGMVRMILLDIYKFFLVD